MGLGDKATELEKPANQQTENLGPRDCQNVSGPSLVFKIRRKNSITLQDASHADSLGFHLFYFSLPKQKNPHLSSEENNLPPAGRRYQPLKISLCPLSKHV